MAKAPAIGIDLGTTNSCVAVMQDGKVVVIKNELNHRTTPSYVAFTESQRLIGEAAKKQVAMNPLNTISNIKRIIGRTYDDPIIANEMKKWPFTVKNIDNKPMIEVQHMEETKQLHPEQISAMIFSKMKEYAEIWLCMNVTEAVITVPAHFNESQRQATKDAGAIAGLNVLQVINEPTAAAIAYGFNKNKHKKNVLIFDFGGGSLNVSIVYINGNRFTVKSSDGDPNLGGLFIDDNIFDYCTHQFNLKYNKDVKLSGEAKCRLRVACEEVKRSLSDLEAAEISISSLIDGDHFSTELTLTLFNELNESIVDSIKYHLDKVLSSAVLVKSQIDEVMLVGGSTRIKLVQKLVGNYFGENLIVKSINPDEAVAIGAAIHAANFNQSEYGLLEISREISSGEANNITITNDKRHLNKEDIERFSLENKKYQNDDEVYKAAVTAKNDFETYCINMELEMEEDSTKAKVIENERKDILEKCHAELEWMEENPLAKKEEYESRQKALEAYCNSKISKDENIKYIDYCEDSSLEDLFAVDDNEVDDDSDDSDDSIVCTDEIPVVNILDDSSEDEPQVNKSLRLPKNKRKKVCKKKNNFSM